MDKKPKLGSQVVDQLLVKAESDDNLFLSLKNLLFISEYSDEEKSDWCFGVGNIFESWIFLLLFIRKLYLFASHLVFVQENPFLNK